MLIRISTRREGAPPELVDLLLECHERIRRFVTLALEVGARREGPDEEVSDACARVARYFTEALPLHVADEEQSIGPRLAGLSSEVDRALERMRAEHALHDAALSAFLAAVEAVRADPSSGAARKGLVVVAQQLELDFVEHLTLEESVLFPAIRALLPADVQARIVDELRLRRSPVGPVRTPPPPPSRE